MRWVRCDAMRCRAKSRVQSRSRASQGVYFYKTRRLDWSVSCSEALESQGRSVVGHLAVKIRIPLAEKRGGCVVGDAGPWTRLCRLDSVESWRYKTSVGGWVGRAGCIFVDAGVSSTSARRMCHIYVYIDSVHTHTQLDTQVYI